MVSKQMGPESEVIYISGGGGLVCRIGSGARPCSGERRSAVVYGATTTSFCTCVPSRTSLGVNQGARIPFRAPLSVHPFVLRCRRNNIPADANIPPMTSDTTADGSGTVILLIKIKLSATN